MRVVFDFLSEENRKINSLNDCLHKGPSLLSILYDVILCFRMYPVGLVGDAQQAFHQIKVAEEESDCLRFFWLSNPKHVSLCIMEPRFARVVFRVAPISFLLNGSIQTHLERNERQSLEFVRAVLRSLYVDDFVGVGSSYAEV